MAEGFGRWESDPLFSAAEIVQDSADRTETIHRMLLNEQALVDLHTPDNKILSSIQFHRRDLMTALETTKWQLEDFEGAVNFAALTNTSNSRAHAISNHRQFIKAIGEQIIEVGKSLENISDFKGNKKSINLNEPEINGLALFLSGGSVKHLQYDSESNPTRGCCDSTTANSDEIVELKPDCERSNDHLGPYDMEAGDMGGSQTSCFSERRNFKCSVSRFFRNLWFINIDKITRRFTKRREDGEPTNGFILDNERLLSSSSTVSPAEQVYKWMDVVLRRFKKATHLLQYNQYRMWTLVALIMLVIVCLGLLFFHFGQHDHNIT